MSSASQSLKAAVLALAILCAPTARAAPADDIVPPPPLSLSSRLDFDLLKETRLFPLFAPSRRPLPPVVEAPAEVVPIAPVAVNAPPPPSPPSLELVGIVEVNGEAMALLKDPSSGRTNCVRAGQTIDEWQLSVIGPRMVALAHPRAAEQQILRVTFP